MEVRNLSCQLNISERAFDGMSNLKFLRFHDPYDDESDKLYLPQGLNNLPQKLRLIEWSRFPMTCLPSNFCTKYLVEIRMKNSKLQNLWQGNQVHNCGVSLQFYNIGFFFLTYLGVKNERSPGIIS